MELRAETQNLSLCLSLSLSVSLCLSLGCVIVNQKASGIEPEPDPAAASPLVSLDKKHSRVWLLLPRHTTCNSDQLASTWFEIVTTIVPTFMQE